MYVVKPCNRRVTVGGCSSKREYGNAYKKWEKFTYSRTQFIPYNALPNITISCYTIPFHCIPYFTMPYYMYVILIHSFISDISITSAAPLQETKKPTQRSSQSSYDQREMSLEACRKKTHCTMLYHNLLYHTMPHYTKLCHIMNTSYHTIP